MKRLHPVALAFAVGLLTLPMMAGQGGGGNGGVKGRTKIDFKLKSEETTSSRFFAKIDVAQGVSALPETGSKSRNDNLAGHIIEFSIQATGSSPSIFSGVADDKGKFKTPFDCKLTANGGILQIKYTGLDLVTLFPLNIVDGSYEVPVTLGVTAKKVLLDSAGNPALDAGGQPQADPNSQPVVLSSQTVTFKYTTKKGLIKGRNF